MYRVLQILNDAEIAECKRIAASTPFVDGRITNPHNLAKENEQLHDPSAYQKSSDLLRQALLRTPEFMEFVCYDNNNNEVKFLPYEEPRPARRRG